MNNHVISRISERKGERRPLRKKSQKKLNGNNCKTWKKRQDKKDIILIIVLLISILIFGIAFYNLLHQLTRTETIDELELTPYATEYIDDDSMELGSQAIEREGKKGERKLYYKVTKTLIGNEQKDKTYLNYEDIVQPTNEIIRRGTRKWQYMWCSDGGSRYYTDEQFSNPNIGFTHSSEDYCAKNGQGTMVQLSDYPPVSNNNYVPLYQYQSDHNYEYTPSSNYSLGTQSNSSYESSESNSTSNSPSEEDIEQKRLSAQNACRAEANLARQSLQAQLGAMGVNGSSVNYNLQQTYNQTYNSCMSRYGF